jgi:hypothetical protein
MGHDAMKKILALAAAAAFAVPAAVSAQGVSSDSLPSTARPGQCYARVLVPATYRAVPMEVVTQEASERIEVSEPTFRSRTETVVTRPEYTRYEVVEPTFRTEAATITTRPAYERLVATQPTMGTRTETVVIREPRLVWRPGANLSGVRRLDPNTGEIYCLVEEPGVTQTVTRRVQATPGSVQRVAVPAQTQTIQRQVLVTPGSYRAVTIPAQTSAVTVQELATPAAERRVAVPGQTSTIQRQELATAERYEWVQVVCDNTSAGRASVVDIQRALAQRGLYRGPIDGIVGPLTRDAVRRFQASQRLPGDGQITTETARALGL